MSKAKAEHSAPIVSKAIKPESPPHPRIPGSMAGKIWIAPDFDVLPDDIEEGLGMRQPSD